MKQAYIKLHISILIAGFTGIFGKLITLNEGMLVWYRLLITSLMLLVFLRLTRKFEMPSPVQLMKIALVGVVLSLHWVFFYASIKASNVSVGVVCFSMTGFFTALLEPLVGRQKINLRELSFSLLAILGIVLIFHFDTRFRTGIVLGTISSALASVFVIVNRKVTRSNGYGWSVNLFYEMLGGLVFMSALMPLYLHLFPVNNFAPGSLNLLYLLLFSLVCTIGLYMLQIQALRHISAFTLNLSYNLEPIYSIVLAMLIFGEARDLDHSFYVGLLLIVLSVVLQMVSVRRKQRMTI